MFVRTIFLYLLFGLFTHALGQVTYTKGYIVNLKKDTLWGDVKHNPKKEYDNFDRVLFKDKNGAQKGYDSDKIFAYGYNDQHYVVMETDGENLFFRRMETGAIDLYKQMFPGYRMNKVSWETEYYITNAENTKPVLLKESKFRRQLSQWMQDKPDFINKINEDEEFDIVTVQKIIKQYNDWKKTGQ